MHDIAGLRQQRARVSDQLDAIVIGVNTSDEDLARHEELTKELASLDRRIAAAETAQRMRAASAIPSNVVQEDDDDLQQGVGASVRVPTFARAREQEEPGIGFAQVTRALIVGKGDLHRAHQFAVKAWGERHPVAMDIGAALQTNDANSGGFLVPERYSAEIIDLLWPKTVIRRAARDNGNVVPLIGGTDNFPTVESGTSAYYIGEGQDITASEPTFGNIRFVEREMAALVPISNKLLRHASVNVDAMIRNMIVRSMAQTEDLAFLRGTGTGPGPRGIRYWVNAANILTANATVNLANIDTDIRRMELTLQEYDIPMTDVRIVMPPRVFTYLRDLRNPNGVTVWESLNAGTPTWKGYRVEVTNNVPKNLGGGGNETEIYMVDFASVVVADSYNIRIDASDTASYLQSATLVSAFSKNQTVIRALTGHDFGLTRTRAAAILTGVTWGV